MSKEAIEMTDEQRLQMITEQLILVRDNLFRGMSKSIQKLQARSINEVLELPSHTESPPAQQEPVAWLHPANATCVTTDPTAYARGIPLYTSPQPAQQQYQSTADKCELTPVPAKGGLLPAQQEPVGSVYRYGRDSSGKQWHGIRWMASGLDLPDGTLIYTSQPAPVHEMTNIERHERNVQKFLAEQPAQQEPFGYFHYDLRLDAWVQNRAGLTGTPFYTSPPAQRKPLSDEQQIAESLRVHGLTLVKTTSGYEVLRLGQITANNIKENT